MAEKLSNVDLLIDKIYKSMVDRGMKTNKSTIRAVVQGLSEACIEVLDERGHVSIPNLFKAELVDRPGRKGFNLVTGEPQAIPDHKAVRISAADKLKDVARHKK